MALVKSNTFTVVDRENGFKAMKIEQERLHRDEADRYEDKQKWAHWGKMYGVGGIIVPHVNCDLVESAGFLKPGPRYRCYETLSIVDSNTGEIMAIADDEAFGPRVDRRQINTQAPSWDEVVEKLIDAYPKHFDDRNDHKRIAKYKQESEENAKQVRALASKKQETSEKEEE
jgi:uncharacterized protein (DUF2249 family)